MLSEGVSLPIGSRDRKPSVSLRSSFAPSPFSLPVDAVRVCGSTEPSGAERSRTRQTKLVEGCGSARCSPSCPPPLQLQSEEGTHSRCCLPAEVRVHKLRKELSCTHTQAHAHPQALDLAIKGAATGRSCRELKVKTYWILVQRASKQTENGRGSAAFSAQETNPGCTCFQGAAGFYAGMESLGISFCCGVCKWLCEGHFF